MPTIEERLARLEKAAEPKGKAEFKPSAPHQPYDYTKHLRLPASAMQDLVRAVPSPQTIANDHIGKSTSLPGVHGRTPSRATPNYVADRPLPTFGQENWPRKKETKS